MERRAIVLLFAVFLSAASGGCAHSQLRWNTVNQAQTLTDIYEKQVLDNLAMFVVNPNALPYFAYPNEGTTNVTDRGALGITGNPLGRFWKELTVDGSREMQDAWGLTPVIDPDKLQLMQCAYQRAVGYSRPGNCVCCCDLEEEFYDAKPKYSSEKKPENCAQNGDRKKYDCHGPCTVQPCWFVVGRRFDVPKRCGEKFGHYCDTFVWVPPENRDQLTRLVLTVLDYATTNPGAQRTKVVTLYLDANGKLVEKQDETAQQVSAEIPIDKPALTLLTEEEVAVINKKGQYDYGTKARTQLDNDRGQIQRLPPTRSTPLTIPFLQFNQQRRALTPGP